MKILIRLGIVLVVLIAGLLIAGQVIVNKPFFREKITKIASEALHREVSLSGLSLSIFPSIGVNLKDFNINEKDGKSSFASLANLRVSVALFPLLKKEVVIKEIYLDHPKINVEKKNESTFNFSDMINAAASAPAQPATPAKTQAPQTTESSAAPAITIDSIRINQAELMYKETLASGEIKSFHLKGLDLGVDDFSFTQPISISVACGFGESAELVVKGKVGPLSAKPEQMQTAIEIDLHGLSDKDLAPFVPKETMQGMGFEKLLVKGNINGSLESGISGNLEVGLNLLPANKEIHLNSSFQAKNLEEVVLKELVVQLGKTAKIAVHGKVGPLNVPSDQIKTDMELDLSGLSSDDLTPFIPAEQFQGNSFQNLSVKGKVQGSMAEQITGDLAVSVKVLPANKDINVKGAFQAVAMETLNLKELSVQVGKTAHVLMKGNISGLKGPQENIKADIDLDLSGLNSAELAPFVTAEQLQGYGFENLTVKGKVQGSMADQLGGDLSVSLKLLPDNKEIRLKGSVIGKKNDEFMLKELSLNMGSSDLTLTGNIKNLKAPKGQFDLKSGMINGEDFLLSSPKAAETKKEEPKKEEAKPATAAGPENPLYGNEVFQNADMIFNADLKKIQFQGNVIESLNLKVTIKQGIVTMNPFALNIFGGKISGTGTVNLQSEKIGFDIQQQMTDVMLEKASKANTGEEKIFGKLTGNASYKGKGLSKSDLQKTLSGQTKVEVKEGKTVGANLKKQVLLKMDNPLLAQFLPGLAKMQQDVKKEPDIKETKFKDFIIDTNVASGKANLQKLNLTTDDFILRGNGVVDFDMQQNLQTTLVFSKQITEGLTGGKEMPLPYENGGLLIPIKITGLVSNPTVLPDFAAIIAALGKGQLGQQLGNLLGGKEGKDGKKSNPLSNLLGGNKAQDSGTSGTSATSTESSPAKQNPLGNLLGGGQNSSGQSQKKSPLGGLFGNKNNESANQNQESSQGQQQDSGSPLNKLKLF